METLDVEDAARLLRIYIQAYARVALLAYPTAPAGDIERNRDQVANVEKLNVPCLSR